MAFPSATNTITNALGHTDISESVLNYQMQEEERALEERAKAAGYDDVEEYQAALAAQERAEMVARYLAARDALEAAQAAQAADADTMQCEVRSGESLLEP